MSCRIGGGALEIRHKSIIKVRKEKKGIHFHNNFMDFHFGQMKDTSLRQGGCSLVVLKSINIIVMSHFFVFNL